MPRILITDSSGGIQETQDMRNFCALNEIKLEVAKITGAMQSEQNFKWRRLPVGGKFEAHSMKRP